MTTVMKRFAMSFALLAFCALGAFAQTDPSGVCTPGMNNQPIFVSGAASAIWACNPSSGTANWIKIYPMAGKTATSDSGFLQNTAVGDTAIKVCHATYSFAADGGAVGVITPLSNCALPVNAVVYNAAIEFTTAATSGGSATASLGISGTGGGAAVLLAATAVASLTGRLQSLIVPQTASGWKKITTTGGTVTMTVAVAALTAGVAEVYLFYVASST